MSGTPAVTWSKFYQDSTPSTNPTVMYGIAKKESGALFASGSYGPAATAFGFVTKISDTDGSAVWLRRHSISGGTTFRYNRCCTDSSGNVYLAGQYITTALGNNFLMVKVDTNGTIQWSAVLNSGTTSIADIALSCCMSADESSVFFVGNSASNATLLINVSAATGTVNWQRQITNSGLNFLESAKVFANSSTVTIMGAFAVGSARRHGVFALPADGSKTGAYTSTGTTIFNWEYTVANMNYAPVTLSVSTNNWGGNANANATSSAASTANTVTATNYTQTSSVAIT
jgi:hypothetical protein